MLVTETTDESTSSNLLLNTALACDDFNDTSFETPQTEADPILELQAKIAALETKLANCQLKLREAEEENTILVGRQFRSTRSNMIILPSCFTLVSQAMKH